MLKFRLISTPLDSEGVFVLHTGLQFTLQRRGFKGAATIGFVHVNYNLYI